MSGDDHFIRPDNNSEKSYGDGFDAGQNEVLSYIGPMLDDWERLSNDQKGQVKAMSPLFVASLNRIRSLMDRI